MTKYLDIFKKIGMVKEGHFELTSGLHSGIYFEKFRLLEHPEITTLICKEIVKWCQELEDAQKDFSTVAGPTTGGIIIAYELARQLGKRCIFAEKSEKGREFKRGFEIKPGEQILVVDDIFTTGGSIRDTISAVERKAGVVVGVGVIVDRSEGAIHELSLPVGIPFFSVYKSAVKNWKPSECPLCKKGRALSKPGGSGKV